MEVDESYEKNLVYEECPEIGNSEPEKEEKSTRKTTTVLRFFHFSFPFPIVNAF